jgi:hypothetical protein
MSKNFNYLIGLVLVCSTVFFTGCEMGGEKSDNKALLLLLLNPPLPPPTIDYGSVTFSIGGAAEETWTSAGFSGPGSFYEGYGFNADRTKSFEIMLSTTTLGGPWDQTSTNYDVRYIDDSGGWGRDNASSFSLTLSTWSGTGGYATGSFSGTLKLDGESTTKLFSGSFNILII